MTPAIETQTPLVCAWAGSALDGQNSGDLEVVICHSEWALVALMDGLGHGYEAALASRTAAAILSENPALPISELVLSCHEGLRGTRGVVMTIAHFDFDRAKVEWCGVGNVEGLLFHTDPAAAHAREALITLGGVVGFRLPPLKLSTSRLWPGDLLVLATDGIRAGFSDDIRLGKDPQSLASELLAAYAKGSDDALVLVARYAGLP